MIKILSVLVIAIAFSTFACAAGSKDSKSESMKKDDSAMMKKDDSAMMKKDDGAMMAKDDGMMSDADSPFGSLSGLGSQIVPYSSEMKAQALAANQTVVYFFAASWCPKCKVVFKDMQATFASIPKNVTIVIANYDKVAELKTKYGVTSQHTFVSIDSAGAKKKIWVGGATVKEILSNVGINI